MRNNDISPFAIDLAAVLGCSATSGNIISPAIKQAKEALGIEKHTKSLTADDKTAIIQWHKARLTDKNQLDIETIAPAVVLNEPLENAPIFDNSELDNMEASDKLEASRNKTTIPLSQTDLTPVEIDINRLRYHLDTIADDTAAADIETTLQLINAPLSELDILRLENAKLQAKLEAIEHKAAPTYQLNELVRLTIKTEHKRVQIALSGFYLNALMLASGINKKGCQAWIQSAINNWTAFDSKLNVTKQVELLIVRELESELIKARG